MTLDYLKDLKKVIEEKTGLDPSEITVDSFFEDDLNVGEMELLDIISEVEEKYHVEIMRFRDDITTVQDLLDLLTEEIE
jgi:acyl carrier protein